MGKERLMKEPGETLLNVKERCVSIRVSHWHNNTYKCLHTLISTAGGEDSYHEITLHALEEAENEDGDKIEMAGVVRGT
jgi:hypothetical protein